MQGIQGVLPEHRRVHWCCCTGIDLKASDAGSCLSWSAVHSVENLYRTDLFEKHFPWGSGIVCISTHKVWRGHPKGLKWSWPVRKLLRQFLVDWNEAQMQWSFLLNARSDVLFAENDRMYVFRWNHHSLVIPLGGKEIAISFLLKIIPVNQTLPKCIWDVVFVVKTKDLGCSINGCLSKSVCNFAC